MGQGRFGRHSVRLGEAQHLDETLPFLRTPGQNHKDCRSVYNCNNGLVTPLVITCGVKPGKITQLFRHNATINLDEDRQEIEQIAHYPVEISILLSTTRLPGCGNFFRVFSKILECLQFDSRPFEIDL